MLKPRRYHCGVMVDLANLTIDTEPAKKRPSSKQSAIQEEVEEIHLKLTEKHRDNYTPAQLRLWANMLQLGHLKTIVHLMSLCLVVVKRGMKNHSQRLRYPKWHCRGNC